MDFADFADRWLDFKAQELEPTTLYTYRRIVHTVLLPRLAGSSLEAVSASDLQDILLRQLADRSANEALKTRAVLRGLFGFASDLGLLDTNPAERIRLPRGVGMVSMAIREVPTPGDARDISAALPERYAAMPLLAAFAGLRWGEVVVLRPSDFEPENRTIEVSRALGRIGGVKRPKSIAGRRKTVWAAEVDGRIRSLIDGRPAEEVLFASPSGVRLHYPNWRTRIWVPACHRAGLRWTFHEYRHTFAVESLRRGRSVQSVASMMGHANPRVTWEFYAGLFEDHLEDAKRAW